jgi:transposase-like protein
VDSSVAGKKPKTFITDGAANFHEAYLQEFHTMKRETDTEHIAHIRLAGDRNNNRMERFNGEVRQREKVMRTLKRMDSPILSGYQIYHNYLRPHEALKGNTPAEKAGIVIKGENKWLTIIQNASQKKR